MKPNRKRLILGAVLAAVALTSALRLYAQEEDIIERAPEEEEAPEPEIPDDFYKPANTWPDGNYVIVNGRIAKGSQGSHLGPTGLWGVGAGQNIWVSTIDPGSPADGKVLPEDVIYGANGKSFPAERDVRYYLATAITEAETKEAGGKLVLHIRRDGNFIQVPIQLKVMGSFSSTTPYNCEKSTNIVAGAEEYMRKGLRPENGLPDNDNYMYGPWNDSVLFLMATGNPELQGLVRRYIRNTIEGLDAWKTDERGGFNPYNGWGFDYIRMLLGEYYHLTGDSTVLPYLEALASGSFIRDGQVAKPEMDWSWPPKAPTGYGTHPGAQMASTMGLILANEAGLNVSKDKLWFNLQYLYVKRAEHGWVKYNGYGPITIEARQSDAPLEITEENKQNGTYSSMNGKLGTAAALFSLVDGYEKAVEMCSTRCAYAYDPNQGGHGGMWFYSFWTPIGACHAGPEKFQNFIKGQQWWRELYRDHTGAMWQAGNARGKKDTLGTGFAIHRTIPRKKLRMFGAPRSMFGPSAPAYMKEALAAHRNRDYARAEQLTLKLQASGTVPATDKARADHFLDSVKTLRESIEYDLAFTEALLKKGNFALASVELPQLEMVESPSNPRLKAIAKALESQQAQAQIASLTAQAAQDLQQARKDNRDSKDAITADFKKELASLFPLAKDGAKYTGPQGTRKGTDYPTYTNNELTPWRVLYMESPDDAPQGWEEPTFDDSKWKEEPMPIDKRWRHSFTGLLRTSFTVADVDAFTALRVRGKACMYINLTLYLNGEIVAKATNIPKSGTVFDLKPEALKLLKRGENTLAVRAQRLTYSNFSLRLDGVLKSPAEQGMKLPDLSDIDPFDSDLF